MSRRIAKKADAPLPPKRRFRRVLRSFMRSTDRRTPYFAPLECGDLNHRFPPGALAPPTTPAHHPQPPTHLSSHHTEPPVISNRQSHRTASRTARSAPSLRSPQSGDFDRRTPYCAPLECGDLNHRFCPAAQRCHHPPSPHTHPTHPLYLSAFWK